MINLRFKLVNILSFRNYFTMIMAKNIPKEQNLRIILFYLTLNKGLT